MSEFTKGPWFLDEANAMVQVGEGRVYQYIADCEVYDDADYDAQRANATLIAAAPDMYEALEGLLILEGLGECPVLPGIVTNKIRVVLAKARGESNDGN